MFSPKLAVGLVVAATLIAVDSTGRIARATEPARKPKAAGKLQYTRVTRDAKQQPLALETAIVRFTPKDPKARPISVDLVGAVHIADTSYFEQLNREFKSYDVVLYELVAPTGTKIRPGAPAKSGSPVSAIQRGMKNLLELDFQLDQIDYSAKNFVHADMTPEEFAKSMRDQGESAWTMLARMFAYAMAKQSQGNDDLSDAKLLMALFDKNRALKLKQIMATQFEDMEGALQALEGPKGSTLIAHRNKKALEVLRQQLAAGKRKIAIFYGAGHLPDFQKRLADDFGLVPGEVRWVQAWDLKKKTPAVKPAG